MVICTALGKEKFELLNGKYLSVSRFPSGWPPLTQMLPGLSDKEIEEKVTSLVKTA